jgi:hypothetical protein
MSRDGRYVAKSQGWRCDHVQGWKVCRKELGMVVRPCPDMGSMSHPADRDIATDRYKTYNQKF